MASVQAKDAAWAALVALFKQTRSQLEAEGWDEDEVAKLALKKYITVQNLKDAREASLIRIGLADALVDKLVKATGAGGAGSGAPEAAFAPPPPKRIRVTITASDAGKVHLEANRARLKLILPSVSQDTQQMVQNAVLFTGRPTSGTIAAAQSLVLLSPELAYVRDAAAGVLLGDAPAHYYDAWEELQSDGPELFRLEGGRQGSVIEWQRRHFGAGAALQLPTTIHSMINMDITSEWQAKNDGQVAEVWTSVDGSRRKHQYWAAYLEAKNELGSSGDGQLQMARYMQASYGNEAERYDGGDLLLQATGCPALGVDCTGPNFMLYGMCLLRGNVVAMEPLTLRFPLLDCSKRWPDLSDMGARMLAAYDVALYHLQQRIRCAVLPGWQVEEDTAGSRAQHARRVQQVLQSMRHPCVDYGAALEAVQVSHSQVARLAVQRQDHLCPLPWPLWGNCSGGAVNYQNVKPLQLERMPDKALFVGQRPSDQKPVVIKFTAGDYPDWIHVALSQEGLTTQLLECRPLPGGGCMVVTELLGSEWQNLGVLQLDMEQDGKAAEFAALKDAIMPQLRQWLGRVHSLNVQPPSAQSSYSAMLGACGTSAPSADSSAPSSSSSTASSMGSNAWLESRRSKRVAGRIALGDARLANCMAKLVQDPATGEQQLVDLRFVDLDWAGVVDVARYPSVAIAGPKHDGVGRRRLLSQDHDVFRLQNC